jgi:hypothetical protein
LSSPRTAGCSDGESIRGSMLTSEVLCLSFSRRYHALQGDIGLGPVVKPVEVVSETSTRRPDVDVDSQLDYPASHFAIEL